MKGILPLIESTVTSCDIYTPAVEGLEIIGETVFAGQSPGRQHFQNEKKRRSAKKGRFYFLALYLQ